MSHNINILTLFPYLLSKKLLFYLWAQHVLLIVKSLVYNFNIICSLLAHTLITVMWYYVCMPTLESRHYFKVTGQCSAHARKLLRMPHTSQCMWLTANLIKMLETAQSSRLNGTSNLRASWPKKISLWVSYDSNTTSAVPHEEFFFCKTGFLLRGTSFCTPWLSLFERLDSY